jgi:virulence factor Mce-like protein
VQARFPRTFNLFPGSPVQILGIERGIVTTLDVEEGSDTVVANMRIEPDVKLPADVRAVVLTDALLGERYIQLTPAYEEGPTFEAGGMIEKPGDVPAEFDELLDALNEFVEGIQGGDLPRLVDNLAEVLDGNGDNLGNTLSAARDALNVLRDYDEDIIRLASKLSGLNETLNQRRSELGTVIQDFSELSRVLADQRVPLDRSLSALARLADETGRLLQTNRQLLQRDVDTLARLGRTASRNIDHVSAALLNSAELFRAAERAVDRERNWLPLVNNTDDFVNFGLETIQDRLGALCAREGLPTETCEQLTDLVDGILPDAICLPPIVQCAPGDADGTAADGPAPLGDVLTETLEEGAADIEGSAQDRQQAQDFVGGVVDALTGGLQSGGDQ